MQSTQRTSIVPWLGPTFLLTLIVIFFALPFPLMDKLHGVCFGI